MYLQKLKDKILTSLSPNRLNKNSLKIRINYTLPEIPLIHRPYLKIILQLFEGFALDIPNRYIELIHAAGLLADTKAKLV